MSSLPTNFDDAFAAGLDGSIPTIRSTTVYLGDDEATYYNIRTHHLEADHGNTGVDHIHNSVVSDNYGDTIMSLYRPSEGRAVYTTDDNLSITGGHRYLSAFTISKDQIRPGDMLLVCAYGTTLHLGDLTTAGPQSVLLDPASASGSGSTNRNIEIELNRGNEVVDTSAKWAAKHNTVPSEVEIINNPDTLVNVALFIVKFVEGETKISVAIGDPYIYSMRSNIPVKLPDAEACYRLYQCNNTFINAEVSVATNEHEQRMAKFVEKLGHNIKHLVTDGYFFSKFYIVDGENKLLIDLRKKSFSLLEGSDKTFFHNSMNENNAGNKDWNGKARNVVIEWITEEGNKMKATVSFFENPHIENGISLSVSNMSEKALGLCVSNYRPKLMVIPSLTTEKYDKIEKKVKKSKNPFQKLAIKAKNEKWLWLSKN